MSPLWLFRMRRWVQHPPSTRRVILVGIVLGLCLVLVMVERLIGWPDLLTVQGGRWR